MKIRLAQALQSYDRSRQERIQDHVTDDHVYGQDHEHDQVQAQDDSDDAQEAEEKLSMRIETVLHKLEAKQWSEFSRSMMYKSISKAVFPTVQSLTHTLHVMCERGMLKRVPDTRRGSRAQHYYKVLHRKAQAPLQVQELLQTAEQKPAPESTPQSPSPSPSQSEPLGPPDYVAAIAELVRLGMSNERIRWFIDSFSPNGLAALPMAQDQTSNGLSRHRLPAASEAR
jgi:hypothetical protein